jgi:tRNA threonylcarbamoyladenosine biosynthesis protein TsaB
MALILNIDTAVDVASICLAKDGKVLSIAKNESQKDHASWLHIAIKEIFEKNNLELRSVDAIAVTGGPGFIHWFKNWNGNCKRDLFCIE